MNENWIIEDEFGNHCFPQESFKDYEDGWEFLYVKFPVIYLKMAHKMTKKKNLILTLLCIKTEGNSSVLVTN